MLERGTHSCGTAYGRRHGRDRRGAPCIRCLCTAAASAQHLVRHGAEQERLYVIPLALPHLRDPGRRRGRGGDGSDYGWDLPEYTAHEPTGPVDGLPPPGQTAPDVLPDVRHRVPAGQPLSSQRGEFRQYGAGYAQPGVQVAQRLDEFAGDGLLLGGGLGRGRRMVGGVLRNGGFWMTTDGPTGRLTDGRRSARRSRVRYGHVRWGP
jgi:hypothetical protein